MSGFEQKISKKIESVIQKLSEDGPKINDFEAICSDKFKNIDDKLSD